MKDNKFKVGDKVRRIEKFRKYNGYSLGATVLTINGFSTNKDILYFEEITNTWDADYFELVEESFEDKIVKAYKMIGTTVFWKDHSNKIQTHKVERIELYSTTIRLYNKKDGGLYLNYDSIIEKPTTITVKLNSEYNATITKDTITVGCQTFPISIIDDLVNARKELSI